MSSTHEDTLAILRGKKSKGSSRTPWDEREKFFSTQRLVRVLMAVFVIAWLVLLGWVFLLAPIVNREATALPIGADLSIVLAPIIAAAAGVERLLETIFNVVEGSWHTLIAYLGYGFRWLKAAEQEVYEARQWLANTAAIYNSTSAQYNAEMGSLMKLAADPKNPQLAVTNLPPEISQRMSALAQKAMADSAQAQQLMAAAEQRLDKAESKLSGLTDSDGYKSTKAALSIVLGLMFGIIVAGVGQLQMFAMLGIGLVPARIDVLITGLVIGSGSYPVHSLVGILQQGKNALDGLQGYLNNKGSTPPAAAAPATAVAPASMPVAPAPASSTPGPLG